MSSHSIKQFKNNFLGTICCHCSCGSCGGLVFSVFVSKSSGLGSSTGGGHCVVFLGKTLYPQRDSFASLHQGVSFSTVTFEMYVKSYLEMCKFDMLFLIFDQTTMSQEQKYLGTRIFYSWG